MFAHENEFLINIIMKIIERIFKEFECDINNLLNYVSLLKTVRTYQ